LEIDYKAIGIRIRRKRKDLGLTQQKLAELSDLEPSNISHIERGATKLGLPTIVSIANSLHCSVDELLCDSLDMPRHAYEKEASEILADCTKLRRPSLPNPCSR
jgi:Helix-turn-helix.